MIQTKDNGSYHEVTKVFAGGTVQQEIIKIWSTDADDWVYEALGEATGALPLTFHADSSTLVDYQIYGADGGVGEPTENMFDESKAGMIRFSNIAVELRYGINFGILPAGAYTISFNHVGSQKLIFTTHYNDNYSNEDIANKNPYTFTTQGNMEIIIRTQSDRLTTFAWMGFTNIMLTEGSTAPASFVPFGYEVDMVSRTRNQLPSVAEQTITLNGVTATCDGKGKYTFTGTTTSNTMIYFNLNKTSFIPKSMGQGGQGTFSIFNTKAFSSSSEGFASLSLNLQGVSIDAWSLNAINKKSDSYTIMGEKNIDGISFYFASGVATNFSASPMITDNGELPATYEPYSNTTTPIYIGDAPLGESEYIDYQTGKIYRMINGTLTPTDPPVTLPALPTVEGETVIDYAGESVAPEKVLLKYRKGGF